MTTRTRLRRIALLIAAAVLLFYSVYLGLLYTQQRRLLFAGWGDVSAPPPHIERWSLGDTRGYGLFLPADAPAPQPLVVFAHGNAEYAHDNLALAARYNQRGAAVLLLEYPGYGDAGGAPTQQTITDDAVALLDRACADPRLDCAQTLYHGRSLGGGVVAQLARQRPPRLLILESTFCSIGAIAHTFFAPGLLARDPFDTQAALPALDAHTLILHGDQDRLIPHHHSLTNRDAARRPTHHTLPAAHVIPEALTWPLISAWLSAHTPQGSPAPSPPT